MAKRSPQSIADQTFELNLGFEGQTKHLASSCATDVAPVKQVALSLTALHDCLAQFRDFGEATRVGESIAPGDGGNEIRVPLYINEFWTAKQRQANSLHEVSYRACFKPQLPRFFIERLTSPGDTVFDPFMGRGTTLVEAALLGRVPFGNDVNPLSIWMTKPRLSPPAIEDIADRLGQIPFNRPGEMPEDLLVFFHPQTLSAISSLRDYLLDRTARAKLDSIDEWIAMVALNRLTGHSNGFFSVYTLPPNQAVSVASQRKINARRNQSPEPRDVPKLILKKSRQLMGDVDCSALQSLRKTASRARMFNGPAGSVPGILGDSVALVVTSPPFLDIVQYATDNWLRCWFLGIDAKSVKLTVPKAVTEWRVSMENVLREVYRVLRPGGYVAWEVGEVHKGATRLEEIVLPAGIAAGLTPVLVLINDQEFTKTSNCWGVDNMSKGTNTNRIVLFRKEV